MSCLKCVRLHLRPRFSLSAAKEDRLQMIKALKGAPDLMERGFLDSFEHFNHGGIATPNSYTALLYNSSIIPCPRGMPAPRKSCPMLHDSGAILLRSPLGKPKIERSHFSIIYPELGSVSSNLSRLESCMCCKAHPDAA